MLLHGAWAPAATRFFAGASSHISVYRDVDFFHCSEATFKRYWQTALCTDVTRWQADVSCKHARNDPRFVTRAHILTDTGGFVED